LDKVFRRQARGAGEKCVNHPIRLYGKKRGNRRTGSGRIGRLGMSLFFGAFLVMGMAFFALLINVLVLPEWRANNRFVQHRCRVLQERLAESENEQTYRPEFLIAYEIDGQEYSTWTYDVTKAYSGDRAAQRAILEEFDVGGEYPCWYDPDEPQTAVLKRDYTWYSWIMLLLPLTFVIIGGGGLIYQALNWGTSTERRLDLARRVSRMELFEPGDLSDGFPTVPGEGNLTNSPGTRLAYRLPISVSPGWALAAIVAACLFWNGMVSIFVTIAVRGHLAGEPDWFLSLFLVPFLLIGLGLIFFTVRQLLITSGVGPTLVEISDHPLVPGGEYEIMLSQSGRLSMNSLVVLLRCQEEATYQQGTNSRTETSTVYEQEVFRREGFEIHQGIPFEAGATLTIPTSAMHSFKTARNAVVWKLVVRGDVAGWPDYERDFPLLVYPRAVRRAG
jgi:hypothetical protein